MFAVVWAVDQTPNLAVYGVAGPFILVLLYAVRALYQQNEKLNEKLTKQNDAAVAQAERLAPLVSDATKILAQAVSELARR